MPPETEVTQLLNAWCNGDQSALKQLAPVVESELRQLARAYLRKEASGNTLEPGWRVERNAKKSGGVGCCFAQNSRSSVLKTSAAMNSPAGRSDRRLASLYSSTLLSGIGRERRCQ